MVYILIFIFGLIIGSFLNAVIYRLHSGDSIIKGRSKCPDCKTVLKARDLVPLLSWLLAKGKCRYCHKKISLQYPLVELGTGLLFILGYWVIIPTMSSWLSCTWLADHTDYIFYLMAVCFLIVIFVYDFKHNLILDKVSIPLMVIALLFAFILDKSILIILLSGFIGMAWFWWQYVVSHGKWVGGGDIRLGAVMGLILGWPGLAVALFLAYLLGAMVSIYLLLAHKKKRQSRIAFGTFLSIATVITWLWGDILLNWYLGLFI